MSSDRYSRMPNTPQNKMYSEPETEFQLSSLIEVVNRRWRVLAIVLATTLTLGSVHFLIAPRSYQATTTLQIERRTSSNLPGDSNAWRQNYWNMEFYPTQYRLLRSRGLAERVVKNLRLYEDPLFSPASKEPRNQNGESTVNADDDAAVLGNIARRLQAGLQVEPVRNTQLVEISFVSPSPRNASRIANGLADAFIDWGVDDRSTVAASASTFLASQIDTLRSELQDKEAELLSYSRSSDIIALEPSINPALQRLSSLNRDSVAIMSDRITKEAAYRELSLAPKQATADTLSGGLVSQIHAELLELESEFATKSLTFESGWPEMVDLKAKIDEKTKSLERLIEGTVTNARDAAYAAYQAALRTERSLSGELQKLRGEVMQQNSAAVVYNSLQQEAESKRSLLAELLRRQSETEVVSRLRAARDSNVRVIDRALLPKAPFRPTLRKNLKAALGLGLLLGLGMIALLEYLDRTVKTAEQVEKLLQLPVLSVIPDVSKGTRTQRYGMYGYASRKARSPQLESATPLSIELLPQSHPRLEASEAYRSLRTALMLSSAEELHTVAVTSSVVGEGKTSTAVNLAVVMAQLGKRVLLVDADLRQPRVHKIFRSSNRSGLVSYLTTIGQSGEGIHHTEISRLDIVPCGPHPPNPSELLASEKMAQFLVVARENYDFIVLDTPPVLAVTDAILVGSRIDGVLLCVRAGHVTRESARTCHERLRLAEVRVLGAVLNGWQPSGGGAYHHYQYYHDLSLAPDDKAVDSVA